MTPESITTFLTGYIQSLAEETRKDKKGIRFGFDEIILQLAQAEDWIPLRLAFHRGGRGGDPRPKKEAEHGVDLKFLYRDGKTVVVFVLKDEPLTYRNWEDEKIHSDLHRASEQDLTLPELRGVNTVRVILAYNKGEEEEGIEEFDRFVKSRGHRVGRKAKLVFERWNLDVLTDRVRAKLLTSPAILPERFFRSFSYLCWQVADFSHGSQQWQDVLLPDWQEFLQDVLKDPVNERNVRLVSIALLVLRSHGKNEPSFETGWIELLEYAVLALWRISRKTKNKKILAVVLDVYIKIYLTSLEQFYEKNSSLLQAEHSLSVGYSGEFGEAAAVYYSYWHMGRLGILALAFAELRIVGGVENIKTFEHGFHKVLGWLVELINSNPATHRPLLDIHHIELYLLWRTMSLAGRSDEVLRLFVDIHDRLLHRRLGNGGIRVIDQSNSWPQLFEFIATGEKSTEAMGRSSYLLQMLIELPIHGLGSEGPVLGEMIFRHLIEGKTDGGEPFKFDEELELQSWVPPENWVDKVLEGPVGDEGICITLNSYYAWGEEDRSDFGTRVESFVTQARQMHPFPEIAGILPSVLFLACIMHKSPVPPEFWRSLVFRTTNQETEVEAKSQKPKKPTKRRPRKKRK